MILFFFFLSFFLFNSMIVLIQEFPIPTNLALPYRVSKKTKNQKQTNKNKHKKQTKKQKIKQKEFVSGSRGRGAQSQRLIGCHPLKLFNQQLTYEWCNGIQTLNLFILVFNFFSSPHSCESQKRVYRRGHPESSLV